MADRQLKVTLVGDTRSLDRALGKADKKLGKFEKKQKKGGGLLGGAFGGVSKGGAIGAGVAVGGAIAVKALTSVIEKAKEAQVAQVGLQQAVESAGVSYKRYGKAIDATIQRVSKLAGIDDEEVSGQFANLVRTTGSVAKATKDIGIAANIARARHISLAAATKTVERAELGSATAFRRVGIAVKAVTTHQDKLRAKIAKLTDEYKKATGPAKAALKLQIDQAKAGLVRAKALDKEQTSQSALDRAQKKFAGSAKAYGDTAQGAQEKFNVAFENLQENIGAHLLPLLTKLSIKATKFLYAAEKDWPRISRAIKQAYNDIKPAIDSIIKRTKLIADVIKNVVKLIVAVKNGDWSTVWKSLKKIAVDQIKLMILQFVAIPKAILTALGKKSFAGLKRIGGFIKDAILSGVKGIARGIENLIVGSINTAIRLINKFITAYNKVAGPLPGVGKVGHLGTIGGTAPAKVNKPPPPRFDAPRRQPQSTGGTSTITIQGDLHLNGVNNPRQLFDQLMRVGKGNTAQTRGRNGGINLGLA